MRRFWQLLIYLSLASSLLYADGQPFDLTGPKVDVHVKRNGVTLPISEAANLLPGDRLWIHPDLPESQATHFVLVVAFLRGSTNPPPPEWFTRVETWTRDARDEGVFVTVPAEAQQALVFLAPETGGDFNTLRNAVRGRPGTFVRAAQDLQAASWERMRLEAYLDDVKVTSQFNPDALKTRTEMAARSLGIKINESCFSKPVDQQASCLSQNSEGMVLDDANAQSLVDQLANGSTLDLMNQLSYTQMGGGGMYSAYVGAIVDTARILASLHTAHFQYIPALALPTADSLNLRLNMPPSFRNPKSVVVVALPPIGPGRPEPLHPVNPVESFCAVKPDLVLPAEGAPLVFGTQLAHDLYLEVESGTGKQRKKFDIPITADPGKGGLVPTGPVPELPGGELTGVVRGKWGFDNWEGPQFNLVSAEPGKWKLAAADQSALVVGRDDTLHFAGQTSVCVEKIEAQSSGNHALPLTWKAAKTGALDVVVPLKNAAPGPVNIAIYQYGMAKPDQMAMEAYDAAASLEDLMLSAGDNTAMLKGTRLDEVAKAKIDAIVFTPAGLNRVEDFDLLSMSATAATSSLDPGKFYMAQVSLKDGRVLKVPVTVNPPRPEITLLSKGVQNDAADAQPPVQLGSANDLPLEGRLVFFLKSDVPKIFPRDEKVEVASTDLSFRTMLTVSDGGLMLEDSQTAVVNIDPLKQFGSSAFGPLRVRAISDNGATSDWLPLGTLVRLPGFNTLRCPRAVSRPCLLSGSNLFLATSFSSTPTFDDPTDVAPEFTGTQMPVPHPVNGILYVKLRDDPATVQTLTLPVTPIALAASAVSPAKLPSATPSPAASALPPVAPQSAVPPASQSGAANTADTGTASTPNAGKPSTPATSAPAAPQGPASQSTQAQQPAQNPQ